MHAARRWAAAARDTRLGTVLPALTYLSAAAPRARRQKKLSRARSALNGSDLRLFLQAPLYCARLFGARRTPRKKPLTASKVCCQLSAVNGFAPRRALPNKPLTAPKVWCQLSTVLTPRRAGPRGATQRAPRILLLRAACLGRVQGTAAARRGSRWNIFVVAPHCFCAKCWRTSYSCP